MKCLHVASRCPNRGEGAFREKNEGNVGVSSKNVLIFKENRLFLIDRYQVFVSAYKINGDFDV